MLSRFSITIFVILIAATSIAANAPSTVAQIALYQGADREKILVEGARREGQVTFYNSHTWFRTFVKDFEKKYPFIKVAEWRNDSKNILRRVTEEAKSGRSLADVIETTPEAIGILKRDGILEEYYSPEARFFPDDVKGQLCRAWSSPVKYHCHRPFSTPMSACTSKTMHPSIGDHWSRWSPMSAIRAFR